MSKFLYKNWQKKSSLSTALLPFSLFYHFAFFKKKLQAKPKKFNLFIVCIGNVTLGGNGKTQLEIELAKVLQPTYKVAFLTVGYKGKLQGPLLVTKNHTAYDIGEEALMLHKVAPTCVAKNRLSGLELLQEKGFDIVLMDDGYQNFKMVKDFNVLVVYGKYGFGNQRVIPAGPLREPLKFAVLRADIICVVDKDKNKDVSGIDKQKAIYVNYQIQNLKDFNLNDRYLAFSGLGFNEKFFNTLKASGFKLSKTISFSDHYFYKAKDIEDILQTAKENNLKVITTSKDYIKLLPNHKELILEAKANLSLQGINKLASFIVKAYKKSTYHKV